MSERWSIRKQLNVAKSKLPSEKLNAEGTKKGHKQKVTEELNVVRVIRMNVEDEKLIMNLCREFHERILGAVGQVVGMKVVKVGK